jgi:hypothetical protein
MAIAKFHKPACADQKNCDCPWRLTYRPQGVCGAAQAAQLRNEEGRREASGRDHHEGQPRRVFRSQQGADLWRCG